MQGVNKIKNKIPNYIGHLPREDQNVFENRLEPHKANCLTTIVERSVPKNFVLDQCMTQYVRKHKITTIQGH